MYLNDYQTVFCEKCVKLIRLQWKDENDPKYVFEFCKFYKEGKR
jgi:hypothetical protein